MPCKKIFKHDGTPFGAKHAAENWLDAKGYSVGPSQNCAPQAIFKGDVYVLKWRDLTTEERSQRDGALVASKGYDAVITLKKEPAY